jgi:hypothetical protein
MEFYKFYKLYYITIPLLSYNLCYTISALSSISSPKNILNYLIETKDTDVVLFKNHLEEVDLKTKIKIIESLIYDVIKKHINNEENPKLVIENLITTTCDLDDDNDFYLINIKNNNEYLKNINEPVLYSLISTCEVIYNINDTLHKINAKILTYEKSYFKKIVLLKLQPELSNIIRYSKILDLRLNLLFDILKVYSPINKL